MKKIYEKKLTIFIFSMLLGCTFILPNIIINHGIFTLSADYNYQQVPFGVIMNYSLKEGSIHWTWFNEIGSSFIGTFSFYNLLSPFSIISYLFPSNWYPYLSGYLMILKFGVAGLTSFLFLKRYVKNEKYAIIGALLYAFSGYQLNNIIFHFYDSVCLFPLLLYYLDNLMYDGKKNRLIYITFILCITDWFMFVGNCVFIFIYTLIKLILKEYNFKYIKNLIIEFILGILLSSFILIPSLIFTSANPRINGSWTIKNMFIQVPLRLVEIVRCLFFPNEIMYPRAFLSEMNYDSVEFYLPFVGMVLAIPHIIKKPKSWMNILMIILIIFMFIPILNSSFTLFTTKYYARWFYMATLICSLTTIKGLEENVKIKSGIIGSLLILPILTLIYIYFIKKYPDRTFIFDKQFIILNVLLMIINIIILCIIYNKKTRDKLIFIFISIFIIIWGNYTVYKYSETGYNYNENYNNYINQYKKIKFDKIVRTNSIDCEVNISDIVKTTNINSFNSNINGSNFEFYKGIDFEREVSTHINLENQLNEFLSVKYFISCDSNELIKNSKFKEMGLVFNKYIEEKEFEKLSTEEKQETILNKIVLNKNQVDKYKNLYKNKTKIISNEFEFVKNGFKSNIELSDETLILYTVPYDTGWTAYNNNEEVEILKVNYGLIAVKGNKGKNKIEFKYFTPGLKIGTGIALISIIIYIILRKFI